MKVAMVYRKAETRTDNIKVALVYDRVNKWGGAERVLLALHEIFPKAPLYTSVYDIKKAPWAKVFPEVRTSFLQKFPFTKNNHEFLAIFMPLAFASFDLKEFDVVISVTSEAAKGVKINRGQVHICYCLTPTRYLWSHYDEYFKGQAFKAIAGPAIRYLKKWDKIVAKKPDIFIAISSEVKNRIQKYYKRDSVVIFPPVNISVNRSGDLKKKYYLIVSRLVKYKKVDLVVNAFNDLGYPLVVIGDGWQKWKLKLMARKNIKFVSSVTEKKLSKYYEEAKALIMPQEEDFGIVALEAQSYGVPVIAYKAGGAMDTVIHGKTGILFDNQDVDGLTTAIKKFEKTVFKQKHLTTNAKRFSKKRFQKEFFDLVQKMLH